MILLTLMQTVAPDAAAVPGAELPAVPDPTLETVGLALLAYGLVQLLSRVLDRLLTSRAEAAHAPAGGGFRDEDRRKLEKAYELVAADRERIQRMGEAVAAIQENTRWLAEQRTRTDTADGLPVWNCRARGMAEQLMTQQRLIGQALDELRDLNRQHETVQRRLRAVWRKLSRWRS